MSATWQEIAQFEDFFPNRLSSRIGDYILGLFEDGPMEKSKVEVVVRSYLIFESISTNSVEIEASVVNDALNEAIATLLDNHLIEKWEYQEDDGAMTDYYDLSEDEDDD